MNRRLLFPYALMATLVVFAFSAVVTAQATRTWVSGVGDDVNPCSRTAPCKTFAGAISKTADKGEIDALDPAGFGTINITKNLTIDGAGTNASILAAGTTGVIVNSATAIVILRNLSINGAGTGVNGIRIVAAKKVVIENCVIFGFPGSGVTTGRGISDERSAASGAGNLFVTNTRIFNNGQSNIVINPFAGATVNAVISDSQLYGSTANSGLAVSASANVHVRNTAISGNSTFGIFAEELSGQVEVNVENTSITSNGTGVSAGAGPVVRLSNTFITGNTTGITGAGVFSWGNNRISGNTGGNGPPTALVPQQQ